MFSILYRKNIFKKQHGKIFKKTLPNLKKIVIIISIALKQKGKP